MARIIETLIAEFISEKIEQLITESKCCIHMTGPYRQLEQVLIHKITTFGLRSRIHIINGVEVMKIYKSSCSHNIHQPSVLQLSVQSQKDILHHLQRTEHNVFQEVFISQEIFKPLRQKPCLPLNRFTIGPVRQTIYQRNVIGEEAVLETWRIHQFKANILKKVAENQVLVINGDVSLEKSTAVPMFIVDESTANNSYCKILCVEADNLSAVTHSTILAGSIKERIGSRVGFQVYLQSRVCDSTNLIYTTAVFFLRVLMGQNPTDSFRHISHIVVSDVHLHHAYTDVLLYEIKSILQYYPQIKIILLSDSKENIQLLSYFDKSEELRLHLNAHDVEIYFLEDINVFIDANRDKLEPAHNVDDMLPAVRLKDNEVCADWVDKALEEYAETGSDAGLNRLLNFVHTENVSVDYTHPQFGYTALILAAKHGNAAHALRLLTCERANPFIQDRSKNTALEYAIARNDVHFARALFKYVGASTREFKPPPVDFSLISKLIQLITTSWKFGHILVFLPAYEDLLRLNYAILKLQFVGKIPQEVSIYLLHSNMQYNELQPIISESQSMKIILATRLAESLAYLNDITYVIDSSQDSFEKYVPEHKCKVTTMEWASIESLQRRALVAGRTRSGHCFRLIPRSLVGKLTPMTPPELLYMPMNRIALTVKLLCPHKTVAEYLQGTIVQPPSEHVRYSIEFLKQIEVFDCMEEVSWLGCRLVDVPMDLELGKALVLSILLKCLDPVLTIVSFLGCTNAREMDLCQAYHVTDNNEKSDAVAEGTFSDHLTLLRLYQMWQNDKRENTVNDILNNETTFVMNGILDKVCGIRTYLVGALRSSQLIHNQGQLSMHSINSKANNWAVIKAALTGGFYPKICMGGRLDERLKSKGPELCIHPISTLRPSKDDVLNPKSQRQPSDWIIFYGESRGGTVNSISNCTLINAATAALFAGRTEFHPENIRFPKGVDQKSMLNSPAHVALFIDEWIWLTTDSKSALLLFSLRQRFNMAYLDFLQTCGHNDKWRKNNRLVCEISHVSDLMSKIVLEEDISAGFVQPVRVGNRPKAMANKFTSDFDFGIHPLSRRREVDAMTPLSRQYRILSKEFFLISVFSEDETMQSFWKMPIVDITRDPFYASICSSVSAQTMTYIVVCQLNRKRITNVALVKLKNGSYFLHNSFQVSIPVYDVIILCKAFKLDIPSLNANRTPVKLDNAVGELILELL